MGEPVDPGLCNVTYSGENEIGVGGYVVSMYKLYTLRPMSPNTPTFQCPTLINRKDYNWDGGGRGACRYPETDVESSLPRGGVDGMRSPLIRLVKTRPESRGGGCNWKRII